MAWRSRVTSVLTRDLCVHIVRRLYWVFVGQKRKSASPEEICALFIVHTMRVNQLQQKRQKVRGLLALPASRVMPPPVAPFSPACCPEYCRALPSLLPSTYLSHSGFLGLNLLLVCFLLLSCAQYHVEQVEGGPQKSKKPRAPGAGPQSQIGSNLGRCMLSPVRLVCILPPWSRCQLSLSDSPRAL